MMEAVRTSETSVDNYFTRQCIPEDNSEHRLNFFNTTEQFLKCQLFMAIKAVGLFWIVLEPDYQSFVEIRTTLGL
jgi:hypothetical protein